MKTTAIVLSAGQGKRLGADIPKQYIEIGGHPLLYYCLKAFEESNVDDVIVVAAEEYVDLIQNLGFSKVRSIVHGGERRYDSVYEGLKAAEDADYVLIHDGARPFIKTHTINGLIEEVIRCDAAVVAGMPVKDTIKVANSKGFIVMSTERRYTWSVQTPQCFNYRMIRAAYDKVIAEVHEGIRNIALITDDAYVFSEAFIDIPVKLYEADYENFKVTTPGDLRYARFLVDTVFNK